MTAGQVAALIAAGCFAVLSCAAIFVLLRLARLMSAVTCMVTEYRDRADLLIEQAQEAVDRTNAQLVRTDAITASMDQVTANMAELSGLPPEPALERAHEALFYVGLGEARYRKLGTYSLGMKQLAKLAQAIVHGPKLIILDEPTNGLDPPARQRMVRLIKEMKESGEVNIVLCSHLLRDVEETCDEVLILNRGRIVHYSNLEEERKANRRFVELETVGDQAPFAVALEKLGCECALSGHGRIKMVMSEGVDIRDIYRVAAERDMQLRRLNYRRDSLEDIFLKAIDAPGGK